MDGTHVKLTTPVESFGRTFTEVIVREPKGSLYLRLGDPRIPVATGEAGGFYLVEQMHVINAYLDKLFEVDGGDAAEAQGVMHQLSFEDAFNVKRTLLSFFDRVAAKTSTKR